MKLNELMGKITEIFTKQMMKHKSDVLGNETMGNISLNQCHYIECIHGLGHPTFSQVASCLDITKASVTASINKLIKEGLVKKERSLHDKRVFNLELTEKGKVIAEAGSQSKCQFTEALKKCLDEQEVADLERILQKIVDSYPES